MQLKEAVEKYLAAVGEFEKPMPLTQFGLDRAELVRTLSDWDEDYHLHQHFELIPASYMTQSDPSFHITFQINGAEYVAILFRASIRDILE